MNSKLQLFNFEGKQVRALEINDEPWFVATDVTKILNLSNTTVALSRLDEDERSKFNLGRQGKANIVKERTVNNPDGSSQITVTTKVTGKGQKYFINKFLS